MNAQEILDIIQNIFPRVRDFAYGELEVPEDFKPSEAVAEAKKLKDKAYEKYKNHPGYNNSKLQDEEYNKLVGDYRDLPSYNQALEDEYLESIGIGPYKEIEQYGGADQGSTWYSIKHFTKHNIYIRTDGYYQSHHGTEFEVGYGNEVKPVQKTVVVFESI